MKRLINICSVSSVLILFLLFDFYLISKVFAIPGVPTPMTSWVRALPLQPTKRSVYVGWGQVTNATGYYLECANSPIANTPTSFTVIANITSNATNNYIHNNLSDGNWYIYRVRAYDAGGNANYTVVHGVAIYPAGLRWEETY
ncbi:MAG: hypothetical protein NTZ48_03685 [Candidatus Omnitrophica bacterium]|nr:hypothetical protein [Candidatus Omnitrophota bacterium]